MKYSDLFIVQECKVLKRPYKATLYGLLFLILLMGTSGANAFLSKSAPLQSNVLVVEGWLPDYALLKAVDIYYEEGYTHIITTGGPLPIGSYLKEYKDYAYLAKSSLLKMGMKEEQVIAVNSAEVKRDRTYHSALALKEWMKINMKEVKTLNLASLGPHTRRSHLLYEKAFGESMEVGAIAIEPKDYDPQRWYSSSAGVRTTINELIGYIYVLLLK